MSMSGLQASSNVVAKLLTRLCALGGGIFWRYVNQVLSKLFHNSPETNL